MLRHAKKNLYLNSSPRYFAAPTDLNRWTTHQTYLWHPNKTRPRSKRLRNSLAKRPATEKQNVGDVRQQTRELLVCPTHRTNASSCV